MGMHAMSIPKQRWFMTRFTLLDMGACFHDRLGTLEATLDPWFLQNGDVICDRKMIHVGYTIRLQWLWYQVLVFYDWCHGTAWMEGCFKCIGYLNLLCSSFVVILFLFTSPPLLLCLFQSSKFGFLLVGRVVSRQERKVKWYYYQL